MTWIKYNDALLEMPISPNRGMDWIVWNRNRSLKYGIYINHKDIKKNLKIIKKFINKNINKKLNTLSDLMILFSNKKERLKIDKELNEIGDFFLIKKNIKYDGKDWYKKL